MKKQYEIIVDPEFIKERNKVLDKQVKFLKSKGYEMGQSYFEWFKDVGKNGNIIQQCIDLSLEQGVRHCYIYLQDVIVENFEDFNIIKNAFLCLGQDYMCAMDIKERLKKYE